MVEILLEAFCIYSRQRILVVISGLRPLGMFGAHLCEGWASLILWFAHCLFVIMTLWRSLALYFCASGEVFNFLVIDDCWILKYQSSFFSLCFQINLLQTSKKRKCPEISRNHLLVIQGNISTLLSGDQLCNPKVFRL